MKTLRILLIEDEKNLAKLLREAMEDESHRFIISYDGKEGFEDFLKYSPDIVISDILLPKMNGLELVKKIKSLNKDIPVILISAYSEKEKLLKAIELGVKRYFIKPFDPQELLDFIKTLRLVPKEPCIKLGEGFEFYTKSGSLYKNSKFVKLTDKERKFLLLITSKEDFLLTKEELASLWEEGVKDETLRAFIKRFRQKSSKNILENVKGRGYRLISAKKG